MCTGSVRAGDAVEYRNYPGETVSVLEMFRDYYEPSSDEALVRRCLAAPIAVRRRLQKEKALEQLLARASGHRKATP
jgi:MOSC domain-containing protein YiiM